MNLLFSLLGISSTVQIVRCIQQIEFDVARDTSRTDLAARPHCELSSALGGLVNLFCCEAEGGSNIGNCMTQSYH